MLEMHADNAIFPLAPQKAMKWVLDTCSDPDAWVFIALIEGEIIGTMAVQKSTAAYSDAVFLQDCWIFVRPAYRMTRAIFRMIKAVKELERDQGLAVFINIVSPTQAVRKVALFKRYFREVGYVQPLQQHENAKSAAAKQRNGHADHSASVEQPL